MSPILVTGAAGFIGFHTCRILLEQGFQVVGLDNVNNYYSVQLKHDRVDELRKRFPTDHFRFVKADLCDAETLRSLFATEKFKIVVNLAAQAGVRYSLTHPEAYLRSNLEGFLNILECSRHGGVENLIYASSSSVYGLNGSLPFSEEQGVDHPISLYAASKRSNELMAHSYSHLFGIPTTGLRFFTVYGPWGRPDMAMFLFADAIFGGKPLRLFNEGAMERDFTYVDDIVESIARLCQHPATSDPEWSPVDSIPCTSSAPFRVFNIGNHSPVLVRDVVRIMEEHLGRKAIIVSEPMQAGDVRATCAEVSRLQAAVGFRPKTPIEVGIKNFLNWYTQYRESSAFSQATMKEQH